MYWKLVFVRVKEFLIVYHNIEDKEERISDKMDKVFTIGIVTMIVISFLLGYLLGYYFGYIGV